MRFCSECGAEVQFKVPDDDNRPRYVCPECGRIHYQNPLVVVGCIPVWRERVLLCRRAIEPRRGLWTLPAGFLENDETVQEGAAREALEEACARVDIDGLFTLVNLPHINQLYLIFRAQLAEPEFGPGDESEAVALFDEQEIPWDAIAFPAIEGALRDFFADRRAGRYRLHNRTLLRVSAQPRRLRVIDHP